MASHHPYVPTDLVLSGYVPIGLTQLQIVGIYLSVSLAVACTVWLISGKCAKLSNVDRILMCWWAFTGLTHLVLEGHFVFSPSFFKRSPAYYLDEVWKEYSKGDSRYAARDSAVVSVEGITAVLEGPASLFLVYAIASKKPYSFVLQLAVCLGQLYGTFVYFITAVLEGDNFAVNSTYYWYYYVLANGFWLVIPTIIAIRCWRKITNACSITKPKRS